MEVDYVNFPRDGLHDKHTWKESELLLSSMQQCICLLLEESDFNFFLDVNILKKTKHDTCIAANVRFFWVSNIYIFRDLSL